MVDKNKHIVVKKFLQEHSLVESNITSFNNFITKRLQEIVDEVNDSINNDDFEIQLGKIAVCQALGTKNRKIMYRTIEEALEYSGVLKPYCIIIPGKLHFLEKEILNLISTSQSHGTTLIPLKLYGKKGYIKLLIGIARGKKKYDKRETIKKKDVANREKFLIDSIFRGLGLDDSFVFEHTMFKIQSEVEMSVVSIVRLDSSLFN